MVIYLWANMLIGLYHSTGRNAPPAKAGAEKQSWWKLFASGATAYREQASYAYLNEEEIELGQSNGHARPVFDAEEEDDGSDSYWDRDVHTTDREKTVAR